VHAARPDQETLRFDDVAGELAMLGLVGIIDPPRNEAIEAVAHCRSAGIGVKMITGDHATTATAIATQMGIGDGRHVLTGADLDRLDDTALEVCALDVDVFARASPEHKLRLVRALQARDQVVSMTGDGVNDAPALKRAGVGVAMGLKGTEAAKEAAEMVLADDNFASITAAVREGRTVYANIKKVISWTLPTNAGEASTIILALLLGLTLPITPVQILWVNMITAVTLGIALAFEPTEHDTMARPPRRRGEPLLSGDLIWHIVLVAGLFLVGVFGIYLYAVEQGYSIDLARTIAVNTLVVMEIFHLLFIRNMYSARLTWKQLRGTRVLWVAVALVVAGQLAITYLPWLQQVFETESVSLRDALLILLVGVGLFVIIELEKRLRLHLRPAARARRHLSGGAAARDGAGPA
jgi:magnesium-transporting ATPase (P-type)